MTKRSLLIIILMISVLQAFPQQKGSVQGLVRTADGLPAPFVNLALKNTSRGTMTDADGEFRIRNINPGTYTLLFSSVGMNTEERTVEIMEGITITLEDVVLHQNARQLAEVTINGSRTNSFRKEESEYVSKVPLENMENAQVYTTITDALLKQQLAFSVDDAVKNAPGLQKMWEATGRAGDGGAYYNARGFILQSQLRNGIAGNVTNRIDAINLERIEVIKGPSATLFGSTLTSYGGLINRVTKKPHEGFSGEVSYSTGSFGFNRISADVNVPLDNSKGIFFRLNTALTHERSWQDNGYDKGYVIAPSVLYDVNDRLSISFDAEVYAGENTSKQMIFFYYPASALGASSAPELGVDYNRSYSANDIAQVSRNTNYFLNARYAISDAWTSQTSFTSTHSFSDGPYAYFYVVPNAVVTGDANASGADYLARADQSTASSQITATEIQQNFVGDFTFGNLRNRMVVGLNFFGQNSNQLFYGIDFDIVRKNGVIEGYEDFNRDKLDSALENGSPWKWPYRYRTNTFSAYVSDVINITDRLIASAGLRIDRFDNKGNFDPASGEYSGDYTQTALSPKFGLVFQPVRDVISLFANYQNGFTNKSGTDYKGKAFKPEHANQLEAGIKVDAFGGKLATTLSAYDITVSNLVRAYPENPNFSIQDGTQVSKGIEAEVTANPVHGLNIVSGFAFNDSEFVKSDEDVLGRRPVTAMSPYTANAWVSYQFPVGNLRGLGAGLGVNYASDNKILNSDTYGVFTLPAYTVLNATLFYDHPKFRVAIKCDNLSDERYWIGYTTMNPQKPRSFTGSLSLKF